MIEDRYLSSNKDEKRYKIIIIGDSNVGKTALFWRFTEGDFLAEKDTQVTTIDFKIKNIQLKDKPAKLYIWDTAGQEKYRSIVSTYFKGCHGVLMVFDLSSERSFKNIKEQWYDLCRTKADKAVIILLGNKSDLERRVSEAEISEWCTLHKIRYLSTSVKNNTNVEESFMTLARMIVEYEARQVPERTQSFALGKEDAKTSGKSKGKCC
jgi:Ras-related protein Rab-1A